MTPNLILAMLAQQPSLTVQGVAALLERPLRTVERVVAALVANGRLRRVGSRKTGHWEIIE